ncbi:MAG: DUF1028 domain-containing protein [candidate division Zixibacteria bacterium]|nr:DUF1028 domain-containing protein [candidate division Zixibacteria bacterium]MBU1471846.1 DUF1028 domain-containing protein [candidate division Zixibacteria bacterium]MBU2625704.1 DUF1028 domain-containing protein [candidate division Zixibacteria bacterium]
MPPVRAVFAVSVALALFVLMPGLAHATFSIVAIDSVSGAVGGAGASCIDGSHIINRMVEAIGSIHTQAYWNGDNQSNADSLLREGLTPDSIISWLANNDAQGNPAIRQYGVVTLAGPGASAGYTGSGCAAYAGHRIGPGYAIQGNILLGPEILDDMETAFLTTPGDIDERLMAALAAADVPGADTRCMDCEKPAISAFIRVKLPGDGMTSYLYKVVSTTPCEEDPIPILQAQYAEWQAEHVADGNLSGATIAPTLVPTEGTLLPQLTINARNDLGDPIEKGLSFVITNSGGGIVGEVTNSGGGEYAATVAPPAIAGSDTFTVSIYGGGEPVELSDHPVIDYYLCGDADWSGQPDIDDVVYLIQFIFAGGALPDPYEAGDADCTGEIDIDDVVFMIQYIFGGGPAPCSGC